MGSKPTAVKCDADFDLRHRLHDAANTASGLCGLLELHSQTGDGQMLSYAGQAARRLIAEIQAIRASVDGLGDAFPQLVWLDAHELMATLRPLSEGLAALHERNIRLAPCPDIQLFGDNGLLNRVMLNLVKNALEACPAGEHVDIGIAPGADRARIQVAHPGTVDTSVRESWRRCLQDLPVARRGVGLIGVARTMDGLSGARLGWDSSADRGTSFWIELPCRPAG